MANNMIQKATAQTVAKQDNDKATMQAYIKQMEGEIRKALPAVMTPERFTRIVLSALSSDPSLSRNILKQVLGLSYLQGWQWFLQLHAQLSEKTEVAPKSLFSVRIVIPNVISFFIMKKLSHGRAWIVQFFSVSNCSKMVPNDRVEIKWGYRQITILNHLIYDFSKTYNKCITPSCLVPLC